MKAMGHYLGISTWYRIWVLIISLTELQLLFKRIMWYAYGIGLQRRKILYGKMWSKQTIGVKGWWFGMVNQEEFIWRWGWLLAIYLSISGVLQILSACARCCFGMMSGVAIDLSMLNFRILLGWLIQRKRWYQRWYHRIMTVAIGSWLMWETLTIRKRIAFDREVLPHGNGQIV